MLCVHKIASFHCLWICFAKRKLFCGLNIKALDLKYNWGHQWRTKTYLERLSRVAKKKPSFHYHHTQWKHKCFWKKKCTSFHHRRRVLSVNTISCVKHNNRDGETCDRSQGSTVTSIIPKVTEHTHIVPPTLKGHLWEHENALHVH